MVGNVGGFCRRKNSRCQTNDCPLAHGRSSKGGLPIFKPTHILPLLTEGRQASLISVTEIIMSKPSDLVQGTLDFLLLKILAVEPLHGFAISRRLRHVSDGVLQAS